MCTHAARSSGHANTRLWRISRGLNKLREPCWDACNSDIVGSGSRSQRSPNLCDSSGAMSAIPGFVIGWARWGCCSSQPPPPRQWKACRGTGSAPRRRVSGSDVVPEIGPGSTPDGADDAPAPKPPPSPATCRGPDERQDQKRDIGKGNMACSRLLHLDVRQSSNGCSINYFGNILNLPRGGALQYLKPIQGSEMGKYWLYRWIRRKDKSIKRSSL
jgi:hypothetical protein